MYRGSKLILAAVLATPLAQADWWIESTDLSLKADLQLLSDYGLIRQPVHTYPLFWAGIKQDLNTLDRTQLNTDQLLAVQGVEESWQQHQRSLTIKTQVQVSSGRDQYKSFGENLTDKAAARATLGLHSEHFSARLTGSYHTTADQGSRGRLDQSYMAAKLGNWVVTAGRVDQFWGPSWDSSTIMSHNARPLPGLSLSRYNSNEASWLSSITGPWSFTTRFARLEQLSAELVAQGAVSQPQLWSSRVNLKPVSPLELGFSWVMMWGGDGFANGLADWYQGLFRGGALDGHENMLAGYDLRYSTIWSDRPVGFYMMATSEDFNRQKYKLTKVSYQLGADVYLTGLNSRLYLEFTGNNAYCSEMEKNNCLYEHQTFRQGYRSYRQAIGSTYDNDALVLQLGLIHQRQQGGSWQQKLAWIRLNIDATDRALPGGNPLSRGQYQRQYQWQQVYQYPIQQGEVRLGTDLTYSDISDDKQRWSGRIFANWQHQF